MDAKFLEQTQFFDQEWVLAGFIKHLDDTIADLHGQIDKCVFLIQKIEQTKDIILRVKGYKSEDSFPELKEEPNHYRRLQRK